MSTNSMRTLVFIGGVLICSIAFAQDPKAPKPEKPIDPCILKVPDLDREYLYNEESRLFYLCLESFNREERHYLAGFMVRRHIAKRHKPWGDRYTRSEKTQMRDAVKAQKAFETGRNNYANAPKGQIGNIRKNRASNRWFKTKRKAAFDIQKKLIESWVKVELVERDPYETQFGLHYTTHTYEVTTKSPLEVIAFRGRLHVYDRLGDELGWMEVKNTDWSKDKKTFSEKRRFSSMDEDALKIWGGHWDALDFRWETTQVVFKGGLSVEQPSHEGYEKSHIIRD